MSSPRKTDQREKKSSMDEDLPTEHLPITSTLYFISKSKNKWFAEEIAKAASVDDAKFLNGEKYDFVTRLVVVDQLPPKLEQPCAIVVECDLSDSDVVKFTEANVEKIKENGIKVKDCHFVTVSHVAFDELGHVPWSESSVERGENRLLEELHGFLPYEQAHKISDYKRLSEAPDHAQAIADDIMMLHYQNRRNEIFGSTSEHNFRDLTNYLLSDVKRYINVYDQKVKNRSRLLSFGHTFAERQESRDRIMLEVKKIENSFASTELRLKALVKAIIREQETITEKPSFLEKKGLRKSDLSEAYRMMLQDRRIPREYINKLTIEVKSEMAAEHEKAEKPVKKIK